MTALQLHTLFQVYYDKVQSQDYPELLADEVDLFLNLATEKIVDESHPGKLEDIYPLVTDVQLATVDIYPTTGYNAYEALLPLDFYYYVDSNSFVNYGTSPAYWIGNKPNSNFMLRQLQVNDANKPIIREPLVTLKGATLNIFHDAEFSVDSVNLRYIRKPVTIDLNTNTTSDLPESTHDFIVTRAVALAIEATESQRYQSIKIDNQDEQS